MGHGTFATVIDCIDGRTKGPVIEWIKTRVSVDFVDVVTEPGPDKVMTQGDAAQINEIRRKVGISVQAHHSSCLAVAAHAECAGNPVSDEEHLQQILQSVRVIEAWNLPVRVIGLWVNHHWQIEEVYDSQKAQPSAAAQY